MNIRIIFVTAALALGLSPAANLQSQDLLFFSTHKNPTQVVGDSKNAFILTEGGVLMYDYRRQTWADNLWAGLPVTAIRYSQSKSRLYVMRQDARVMEYNTAFRRFTDASGSDWDAANDAGGGADLTGLSLEGNDFFMGDGIRDKYMRKVGIAQARVFDYDNLWVLTQGFGAYYGSLRRKHAASFWFGLDDPAPTVIYPDGDNNIWFGSCRTNLAASAGINGTSNGSLVKAKADLNSWKVFPAQLEYGFGDGCIHDIKAWNGYIWLATEKGVVRHDPLTGQFKAYEHLQGGTDVRVYSLHVHEGALYAASEQGVSFLADPKAEFQSMEVPISGGVAVYELETKDKDLWAASRYGLYVHQPSGWKSLKEVSGKDVPEAFAVAVPSVAYHDTSLYWISGDKVMVKPRKQQPQVLTERDRAFRIRFDGDVLYIGYYGGVTAYDISRHLWTDFKLEDGIPGTLVQTFTVSGGKLWIGTDAGVERINLRPYLP